MMRQYTHVIDTETGFILASGLNLRTKEDDLVVMSPKMFRAKTHRYNLSTKKFNKISDRERSRKAKRAKEARAVELKAKEENLQRIKDLLPTVDPAVEEILVRLGKAVGLDLGELRPTEKKGKKG